MGIADELGIAGNIPKINITGFLSNTWIYVAIVVFIGIILVAVASVVFFLMTYNRKIVFFDNISGRGYQPVLKTRGRILKLGVGGEELLKSFRGGYYLSAYGRKMGSNTYWYAKGSDGYYYNVVLGDLDSKNAMLDIEPIDRDVRMFHVALDRLSKETYGKQGFLEKYAVHLLLFVFLIVLILGMWFIVGKIGEAVAPLSQSTQLALQIQEANDKTISKLDALIETMRGVSTKGGSGIVPVS